MFSVLFASVFSATLGLGIIVPLLPFYAESLGATGLWIGIIFSGFAVSRAVFMPVIGRLSDRKGRRLFLLAGLLLYTLVSVAYISATSVETLTLVRMLHGFASAMVIPVAMAYAADFSPEGREGKYMGTFMVSLFLGMGVGPLLGGVILDMAGMDAVFLSMAVFSAFALGICALFLPEAGKRLTEGASLLQTVRNRILRPVLFFRVAHAFGRGTLMVFVPLLVAAPALLPDGTIIHQGLSATEIGIVISASVLSTAFLQRSCGKLADRHNKVRLIVIGSVIDAVALITLPFLDGFLPILALALFFGFGSGIALPAATSFVTIAGRETGQGAAMGAFNTAMSIGMITAPLIFGAIMDASGIFWVFMASAGVSITNALLFYRMSVAAGIA
ncbi:MAG: MFS transporter [Methanoculleus sp. SDB]|nr:MAG: MFS transporter [Methanoculleus sp. SDB]